MNEMIGFYTMFILDFSAVCIKGKFENIVGGSFVTTGVGDKSTFICFIFIGYIVDAAFYIILNSYNLRNCQDYHLQMFP